jgi:hypothetical protein
MSYAYIWPHPEKFPGLKRRMKLERSEERFQSELGELVPTATQVYTNAADCYAVPMNYALPTDCIRPFDAGCAIAAAEFEEIWREDDYYDWWDERQAELEWDAADPCESKVKAWFIHEYNTRDSRWCQEDRMWAEHEFDGLGNIVVLHRMDRSRTRDWGTW